MSEKTITLEEAIAEIQSFKKMEMDDLNVDAAACYHNCLVILSQIKQ